MHRPNPSHGAVGARAIFPILGSVFAALLGLSAFAQTVSPPSQGVPGPPASDRPGVAAPTPAAGALAKAPTAVIRGRVTSADTNTPIRRAQIRLAAFMPTATSLRETRSAATDDQGRYEIKDLPAGRYTVSASKTGYATKSYGQRPLSEAAPQPVELTDAQTIERIDLVLPRGGVVAATVVDSLGEPLAGVQVDVLRPRFVNGQRILSSSGSSAETNDLGQTRIHGLIPGDYYISARSGFATLSGGHDAYVPTYYPGTAVASDAQRVPVSAAQEVQLVLPVLTAKQARISGTVRRSDGTPITESFSPGQPGGRGGFQVSLRQDMPGNGFVQRSLTLKPDGSFSMPSVLPGDYSIEVRPSPAVAAPGTPASLPADPEYARVPLKVNGDDIAGITVTTQKGATLRGRVLFDVGAPPSDADPNVIRVTPFYTGTAQPISTGTTTMHDDWSFEIVGVVATGLLRLSSTTTGWSTKSVEIEGKDVTETPVDFDPGREYRDVVVTLTKKRAEVTGTVVDAQGRATNDYVAVLFPEERELWFPRSRNILAGRPDQNGQFRIPTLPPGRFLIAAVPSLENGEEQDPELLAWLAPKATRVALGEGEAKTMTLKLLEGR